MPVITVCGWSLGTSTRCGAFAGPGGWARVSNLIDVIYFPQKTGCRPSRRRDLSLPRGDINPGNGGAAIREGRPAHMESRGMYPGESAAEVANGDIHLIKASCSSIAGPPPRHGRPVLAVIGLTLQFRGVGRVATCAANCGEIARIGCQWSARCLGVAGLAVERGGLIGDGWMQDFRRQGSVPREIRSVETLTVFCAG